MGCSGVCDVITALGCSSGFCLFKYFPASGEIGPVAGDPSSAEKVLILNCLGADSNSLYINAGCNKNARTTLAVYIRQKLK